MFKVGQKLYCKKNFTYNKLYIKNEMYIIEDIDMFISNTVDDIKINGNWFYSEYSIDCLNSSREYWVVWDYFYTTHELRKLKLEKIRCLK